MCVCVCLCPLVNVPVGLAIPFRATTGCSMCRSGTGNRLGCPKSFFVWNARNGRGQQALASKMGAFRLQIKLKEHSCCFCLELESHYSHSTRSYMGGGHETREQQGSWQVTLFDGGDQWRMPQLFLKNRKIRFRFSGPFPFTDSADFLVLKEAHCRKLSNGVEKTGSFSQKKVKLSKCLLKRFWRKRQYGDCSPEQVRQS